MSPARRTALVLLALPVLALSACGGGGDAGSTGAGSGGTVAAEGAADAQTATVSGTAKLTFSPDTVTAKVGSLTLGLRIDGGVPHNLVFEDSSLGKDIPTVSEGTATSVFRFPKAGTYAFVCTLHEGMVGKVVVS